MRIYYTLTTIDPIIVSQSSATTNMHQCLDYIPGSSILGAFANQHYANYSTEQNWQVFHNGQVKFSPCYLVVGNEISLPTPASWNITKNSNATSQGKYDTSVLTNHSANDFTRKPGVQYKQCRNSYINSAGSIARVLLGNTTKTAINNKTGAAEEGQLFTYRYIEEGQTFAGWIDLQQTDNNIQADIKTLLSSQLRIGRSRNTEFGRVQLNIVEHHDEPDIINNQKELTLWCLSDVELLSENGSPTLTPNGINTHSVLAGAKINAAKTFIRSTTVSRFNQKRQGLDTEQKLIAKGSVLTFTLEEPLSKNNLHTLHNEGIGINKQYGLGWVSVNPDWAKNAEMSTDALFTGFSIHNSYTSSYASATPNNPTALMQWLQYKIDDQTTNIENQDKVNYLIIDIVALYNQARQYSHILHSNEAGPSSTQWRRISEKVRGNHTQWQHNVFDGEQAICKANNDELGWGIVLPEAVGQTTFADKITTLLKPQNINVMRLLLEQLCRYDLSTWRGLKNIQKEYELTSGGNRHE